MRRFAAPIAILAAGTLICLLLEYWSHVRNEFFVLTGARNETGGWYGFHSGLGGAAYLSVIPAGMLLYWHHSCHVSRCLRPGRHRVDGSPWCNKHHIGARQKLAATGSAHDLGGTA
jgi:hypothetical protein